MLLLRYQCFITDILQVLLYARDVKMERKPSYTASATVNSLLQSGRNLDSQILNFTRKTAHIIGLKPTRLVHPLSRSWQVYGGHGGIAI